MEINYNKVKSDLRLLKKIQHSIEIQLEAEKQHQRRLEILSKNKNAENMKENISRLEKIISELGTEEYIRRATEIEEKYWKAINSLQPLDKTIIIDGYINGTSYWQLANKLNYSTDAIKKRIPKIIQSIAERINEENRCL